MKNLPTLRNDSSFAVQFSISVSKTRVNMLFTIKIIEMFELHASIPGILSQPIFQCYLWNGTRFHQSVIVAILHYSANLVLTLSYLSKTPQLKYVYYSNAKEQAVTCA